LGAPNSTDDISAGPMMQVTAIIKAITVFCLTLVLSWSATGALRMLSEAMRGL
jgi:hypothetical protein